MTCELSVRNTGNVVDEFTMSILGDSEGWASVEPPVLSLFPGAEERTQLRFRPPRSADTPAGEVPFGVRVRSREDPQGSVVEEGTLEVGTFSDVFAELVPRASRGRRAASHTLALDNRGNAAVNATLKAKDPNDLLTFDFEDPSVLAEPNTAAFAKLKVKPRKGFLRGPARTHSFQVFVDSNGSGPSSAEASMLQEPLMPKWLPKALLAVLVLILFWYVMFKPEVREVARAAVQDDIAEQGAQLNAVSSKLDQVAATQAAQAASERGCRCRRDHRHHPPGRGRRHGRPGRRFRRRPGRALRRAAGVGRRSGRVRPSGLQGARRPAALAHRRRAPEPGGRRRRPRDPPGQRRDPAGQPGQLPGPRLPLRLSLTFKENQELVMVVTCANPAEGPRCTPASYFAGFTGATPTG